MKKLLVLIIFLVFISCKKESINNEEELNKSVITEKLTYEVINSLMKNILEENQKQNIYVVCENFPKEKDGEMNDYMGISKMDSLFSSEDVKFIIEQNKTSKHFLLKKELLKNVRLIPNDTIESFRKRENGENTFWEKYTKKYGDEGFYSISKPLFSLDYKTVIISYGFHCGGLCGGGSTIILRKINEKWEYKAELQNWVS